MTKLRYGCVGAGGIANYKHLKGYSALDNVEIVAVSDPDEESSKQVSDIYKIKGIYDDYREMLQKEKLDLISVCTPNYLHKSVTLEALKHGIHVHCEKPLALNAAEAQEMVDAKDRCGKKLMVALNNRFTGESCFTKKLVRSGDLGEIYHARCGWRRRRGIPGKGGWFTNKRLSGGGPLIDLGVHFIDLVMYFMDYPQVAAVSGKTYSKFAGTKGGTYDVEDMAVGFVRLADDTVIDLEFSWASNIEKQCTYYELLGTRGGVEFRDGRLKIYTEMHGSCVDIAPANGQITSGENEFVHFINCILNDTEPVAKPEEGVKMMQIIDSIYASSEMGSEIILKETE